MALVKLSKTDFIGEHGKCSNCGAPVSHYACNDDFLKARPVAYQWDWYAVCDNEECPNHAGQALPQWEDSSNWEKYDLKATLFPMITAPRDGTRVLVYERETRSGGETHITAIEARVVMSWVTDEFIPAYIADGDTSGLNHSALSDEHLLGWTPIPQMYPDKTLTR